MYPGAPQAPSTPTSAHRLQEVGQFLPPVPALGRGQLVPLAPHSTALLLLWADLGDRGTSEVYPGPLAAKHSPSAVAQW